MAPGKDRSHLCWWPLILKISFTLYFIGSVGFDDHVTDSSLVSILFASTGLGGAYSAGAYQQIVKNMQKKFISILSHRQRSDLHPSSMPAR
jgi:hypothetical protein